MGFFDTLFSPIESLGEALAPTIAAAAPVAAAVAPAVTGGGTTASIAQIAAQVLTPGAGEGATGPQGVPGEGGGVMGANVGGLVTALSMMGKVAPGSAVVQMSTVANGLLTLTQLKGIGAPAGGGNRNVTVVFSFNRKGEILVKRVEVGTPKVMSSEARRAKKFFKEVSKLGSRLPRKVVRESKNKQLTEAIQDRIMAQVMCPPRLNAGPDHCG